MTEALIELTLKEHRVHLERIARMEDIELRDESTMADVVDATALLVQDDLTVYIRTLRVLRKQRKP